VHVVIIGLSRRELEWPEKRLFSYDDIHGDPVESRHRALSPYLFDAGGLRDRHLVVQEISSSLAGMPKVIIGSKPIDGGNYIFDRAQKDALLAREPEAEKFLHPYFGSEEFINGGERWILALQKASPEELRNLPLVKERVAAVRKLRLDSKSAPTRALAATPTLYHVNVVPDKPFIVVPEVSSERRSYVPIGWAKPPAIPSSLVRVVEGADLTFFGILTSAMHMAWLRNIGGRLKSDYRYSIGIVYNTFPWPEISDAQKEKVRVLAQGVLDARAKYPDATLADLYDPDTMPADLRKAHHKLDAAVDALYKRGGFASDRERVEHLFGLYEKLVAPLEAAAGRKRRAKAARG
jgi:hypothetical protein